MAQAVNVLAVLLTLGMLFMAAVASVFNRHANTIWAVLLGAAIAGLLTATVLRRRWGLAVLGTLGLAAAGILAWHAAAPTFSQLTRDGDRMVAAVEQYRQAHGQYPESLGAAGVVPPETRYGPWRYESDASSFTLAIGDYGRDLFVLFYSSRYGSWYADT